MSGKHLFRIVLWEEAAQSVERKTDAPPLGVSEPPTQSFYQNMRPDT